MSRRYRKLSDGQEVSLAVGFAIRPGSGAAIGKIKCCDCGLVHWHRIRLTRRGTIKFTSWRDKKATALARKRKKK